MEHRRGFFVLIVCFLRSCQISHSIGLTIDNQLIVVANDCYTRIAIGSKLFDVDVFSSVAVDGISECEDECSKKRNSCNAFAFGIGVKGNGTCALSAKMPKAGDLQPHADYDVYVRSERSPHCEADRLYKMDNGGGIGQERRNETRPTTRFGSGFFGPTIPSILSSSRNTASAVSNVANGPSYLQGYMPSFDDDRRISDILRNRNPTLSASNPFGANNGKVDNDELSIYSNPKSTFGQKVHFEPSRPDFSGTPFRNPYAGIDGPNFATNLDNDYNAYKGLVGYNEPFKVYSKPIFIHDGSFKYNKPPVDFAFWNDQDPTKYRNAIATRYNSYQEQGFPYNPYKSPGIVARSKQNELITGNYGIGKVPRPISGNAHGLVTSGPKSSKDGGFKDTSDIWNPGLLTTFRGFGAKIAEKSKCECHLSIALIPRTTKFFR